MYTALIIGAGNIAGGFDDINSSSILTHAHAYINNPDGTLHEYALGASHNLSFEWENVERSANAYKYTYEILDGEGNVVSDLMFDNFKGTFNSYGGLSTNLYKATFEPNLGGECLKIKDVEDISDKLIIVMLVLKQNVKLESN